MGLIILLSLLGTSLRQPLPLKNCLIYKLLALFPLSSEYPITNPSFSFGKIWATSIVTGTFGEVFSSGVSFLGEDMKSAAHSQSRLVLPSLGSFVLNVTCHPCPSLSSAFQCSASSSLAGSVRKDTSEFKGVSSRSSRSASELAEPRVGRSGARGA